jgi:hypothetical protein
MYIQHSKYEHLRVQQKRYIGTQHIQHSKYERLRVQQNSYVYNIYNIHNTYVHISVYDCSKKVTYTTNTTFKI